MRYWIETGAQKSGRNLTSTDVAALNYLDGLMHNPENMFQTTLGRGDMLLVSNHTIAHNRTAYTDHSEVDKKRLLVRMWIHTDR